MQGKIVYGNVNALNTINIYTQRFCASVKPCYCTGGFSSSYNILFISKLLIISKENIINNKISCFFVAVKYLFRDV